MRAPGRWLLRLTLLLLILAAPLGVSWLTYTPPDSPWSAASRASADLAPDPRELADTAIVQVYTARTYGWRGYFATHPWIILKRAGDTAFTRYDVVRWRGGGDGVVRRDYTVADGFWYGAEPRLLVSHQGGDTGAMIDAIEAAIEDYPFRDRYRSFPGPNSNTFLAHIGRQVPALALDLPPTAIGKDYRPLNRPAGHAPSGGGAQLSILGLFGVIVAPVEGLEINVLGLGYGVDPWPPALRLPGLGRVGAAPERWSSSDG